MTVWHPASTATQAQAVRAKQLLSETLQNGTWREGVLAEENGVQYRGAYHPNKDGSGRHPGVEVWLPEPAPMTRTTTGPTDNERELVLREGESRGWPREELNASIYIESGWDPRAHNKQRFGGLIGFSPGFARKWAGSPESLWNLSIAQQAPLVGKYFDGVGKRWRVPGDTYLALAAPAFVGAPDSQIVYARGTKAWEQNPGWRGPDGEIRAGSIRAVCLRKMKRLAGGAGPMPAPKVEPAADTEPSAPLSLSGWAARLLSAMALRGSYLVSHGDARDVVEDFQREHKLAVDGVIGRETLTAILNDAAREFAARRD